MRLSLGCALILVAATLAGCGGGGDNTAANTTDPHWVAQAKPPSKVAVVFVHGIFGDTDATWTNANGQSLFKLLKSVPELGDQLDIFAFGFTSNKFKAGSLDIREAANMLEQTLQYDGVWDYDTVVFVAHSMGGLIVMRELIDNPAHREKVPLLMFYAVPQEGSQITAIAQHVVNNNAIRQMLMSDQNDFLKLLSDGWGRIPDQDKPTIICAYETAPLDGVTIVPWSSATRFCKDTPVAIQSTDHLTIVKPDRLNHPSMMVLVNALKKYVFGAPGTPLLATPDFVPESDHWTYELTDPNGRNVARLINNGTRKLNYTIEQISDPKLMVLPDDTPKDIPAGHSDDLQLVLMRGTLQPEYRFTLSVPPLADRIVVVHIKDVPAVQAKLDAVTREVTTQVTNYLASPPNVARLNQLTREQQFAKVADVAAASISKSAPDLPAAARWVVTADALSALGMLAPANAALLNAKQASPRIASAPSAQLVAGIISAKSGEPNVLRDTSTVPELGVQGQVVYADVQHAQVTVSPEIKAGAHAASDLHARSDLSAKLQRVPSLQAYGYNMQGDVLWAQGHATAAKKAYQNASAIQSTPVTEKKLEAVKVTELKQGH
jgi:hypothetical protein